MTKTLIKHHPDEYVSVHERALYTTVQRLGAVVVVARCPELLANEIDSSVLFVKLLRMNESVNEKMSY